VLYDPEHVYEVGNGRRRGVLVHMEENWMQSLGLGVLERRLLAACAGSEELTAAKFARKALWQEFRRQMPRHEAEETPLFPPGWDEDSPT